MGVRTGISQRTGQKWSMQDVLVEYKEKPTQHVADEALLSVNSAIIVKDGIVEGDPFIAAITLEVKEYNGRMFNVVKTHMFRRMSVEDTESASASTDAPKQKPDELPFS